MFFGWHFTKFLGFFYFQNYSYMYLNHQSNLTANFAELFFALSFIKSMFASCPTQYGGIFHKIYKHAKGNNSYLLFIDDK